MGSTTEETRPKSEFESPSSARFARFARFPPFATLDLDFIGFAMSEAASRPLTRAASKQNYAAQPVTAIRDKFEKSRGHIKAHIVKDCDFDDAFADLPMAPALPGTDTFIGTPPRPSHAVPSTPLAEMRHRAATVRAALEAALPKLPLVPCDLEGRELALAEEAALAYEPTGRDIMQVLGQIAKNMVVKDDLRAEITEALQPVYTNITALGAKTDNLNARLSVIENKDGIIADRVVLLEAEIQKLQLSLTTSSSSRSAGSFHSKPDASSMRISFKGFTTEPPEARTMVISAFMRQHFENVSFTYIGIRMMGPYDKKQPSDESFIQFVCQEERDRIFNTIVSKKLRASSSGKELAIGRSKSDWIRKRDFAMRESERLIIARLRDRGQQDVVKFEKSKAVRKITVAGVDAFVQNSGDAIGEFKGTFGDLAIP